MELITNLEGVEKLIKEQKLVLLFLAARTAVYAVI